MNYGEKAEYINNSILEKKEHYYDFIINVNDAENVSITVDTNTVYVTEKEFNENNEKNNQRLEEIEQINSRTLSNDLEKPSTELYFKLFTVNDISNLGLVNNVLFRVTNLKEFQEEYDSLINLRYTNNSIEIFETQRYRNSNKTNSHISNIVAVQIDSNTIGVFKKRLAYENIGVGIFQKSKYSKVTLNEHNYIYHTLPERKQIKLQDFATTSKHKNSNNCKRFDNFYES